MREKRSAYPTSEKEILSDLADRKCTPCQAGGAPLEGEVLVSLAAELGGNWALVNEHHLEKEFAFDNFQRALDFTNKIGALAEREGHHPDIHLSWGKVRVVLWTHKINGLTESDFILASKIDLL